MSFRKSRRTIDLRKASLPKLEERHAEAVKQLASAEKALIKTQAEAETFEEASNKLKEIERRLETLRTIRVQKPGVLSRLLHVKETPPELRAEIALLETIRSELVAKHFPFESLFSGRERERTGLTLIASAREYVEQCRTWVCKLESALDRKRKRNERVLEWLAAAAANNEESRRVGSSVKRRLNRQSDCPYCGGPLGVNPQVDHIYPVSKGGRSVPKNMVFACAVCNQLKRDMTVTSFAKKHCLDRTMIEERLSKLGKEF